MNQSFEMKLSFDSWVYISGFVGLCGGFAFGTLSAMWSLLNGEWLEAVLAFFVGPLCGLLSFALYGIVGYYFYKKITLRFPGTLRLSGVLTSIQTNDTQS